MSLTLKHINFLLKLLNEETCGSLLTFEQILIKFQYEILKSDYFSIGNCFVFLLKNRDLIPTIQQRLIIYYLFIQMYKNDQQSIDINPFSSVFLSLLQSNNDYLLKTIKYFHSMILPITKHEHLFIHLLINNDNKNLFNKIPNEILKLDLTSINEKLQKEQQNKLKEKITETVQQLPVIAKCHLSTVIDDPEINNYGFDKLIADSNHQSNNSQETIEKLLLNNCMKQTIHPEYIRLVPPLHEFTLDEFIWLEPILNIDNNTCLFSWDSSMCISNSKNFQIYHLMNKAYQRAINFDDQQKILDELNNNPQLIHHIDFLPSKFPLLVENNPLISIHCLLKLTLLSTHIINDYLLTLVNMNISLNSIEVVNRLSTIIVLPKEFINLYITTCINTCNQTKDKSIQNRFVCLVSVFIQSLIRNKTIDIKDRLNEIQKFSINYQNIKEANVLYQLIKTSDLYMDNDNNHTKAI